MTKNEFLLEIRTEELPAIPFLKEVGNILPKWLEILSKNGFQADFELFYTPRRITLYSKNFCEKANDEELELWGPPVAVALKDGVQTKAYESFLSKNSLLPDEVLRAEKDGKECLYAKKTVIGKNIKELINEIVNDWLNTLHFGKSMRWGSLAESFIRPIRSCLALYGSTELEIEVFGVKSGGYTYGHRQDSFEPLRVTAPKEYFEKLSEAGVMLSQKARRDKVLEDIRRIEEKEGIEVEIDEDLLSEVVAITEYPTALLGSFDKEFLRVPPEVIITSMKENQRYFPVFVGGKLSNAFIVVSNAFIEDFSKVIAGNERVLKARLSDALFFYDNDLKKGLSADGLANIVFVEGLGTLLDKTARETQIVEYLCGALALSNDEKQKALEAAKIAKADLLTEVVYEFPELQGVMGRYYALAEKRDEAVAEAIKEQYMPKGEDGELPKSVVGAVLATAVRLDSLMGLFSLGMIPSGSKDPYALRRAAIGVIKNLIHFALKIDLSKSLSALAHMYKGFDMTKLEDFVFDRLYQLFSDINPSVITAVLASGDKDIVSIAEKIESLSSFVKKSEFKEQFSTFKRVANISKDVDLNSDLAINTELFENDFETILWAAYIHNDYVNASYYEVISALFALKPQLDAFFENCMVNADDEKIRTNRKHLVARIYKEFLSVADIKEITI